MNRKLLITAGLFLFVALPGIATARQMVLEMDPQKLLKEEFVGPKKCDNLHQTTGDCKCCNYHVVGTEEPLPDAEANASKSAGNPGRLIGTKLTLQSATETIVVRINRVTPLYRLDSGATFIPANDWNPFDASGERWISEHAGVHKNRVVTSWIDANSDGLVGVSDELFFDNGEPAKIVNVGIGLHVATEEPRQPRATHRPRSQQQ